MVHPMFKKPMMSFQQNTSSISVIHGTEHVMSLIFYDFKSPEMWLVIKVLCLAYIFWSGANAQSIHDISKIFNAAKSWMDYWLDP